MKHNNFVDPTVYEKKQAWITWWNRVILSACVLGALLLALTIWQLYRYGAGVMQVGSIHKDQALFDNSVKVKQGLQQKKKLLTAQHDRMNTWLNKPPSPYRYLNAVFTKAPHDLMISSITFVADAQLRITASSTTLAVITAYRDALAPEISFAPLHIVSVKQAAQEEKKAQFAYDCVLEGVEARNGG